MPRGKRIDHSGAWHHAMDRGITRRAVFEDRVAVRYFLANLARVVRVGDLEEDSVSRTASPQFPWDAYRQAFGDLLPPLGRDLVEARILHPSCDPDPLEDLVHAAPESVERWMRNNAQLAHGTRSGLPFVSVEGALVSKSALKRKHASHGAWVKEGEDAEYREELA